MNTQTKNHKAFVEKRSQKSVGRWPKCGPDTYIAVQIVPDGVERLTSLRSDIAAKRGIEIIRIGEGYSSHTGPRSSLGKAMAEAKAFAEFFNSGSHHSSL